MHSLSTIWNRVEGSVKCMCEFSSHTIIFVFPVFVLDQLNTSILGSVCAHRDLWPLLLIQSIWYRSCLHTHYEAMWDWTQWMSVGLVSLVLCVVMLGNFTAQGQRSWIQLYGSLGKDIDSFNLWHSLKATSILAYGTRLGIVWTLVSNITPREHQSEAADSKVKQCYRCWCSEHTTLSPCQTFWSQNENHIHFHCSCELSLYTFTWVIIYVTTFPLFGEVTVALIWCYVTVGDVCLFGGQYWWKNLSLWRKQAAHWLCSLLPGCIKGPLYSSSVTLFFSETQHGHWCSPNPRILRSINLLPCLCVSHIHTNKPGTRCVTWSHRTN